jgi:ATP diphosphatase
MSELEKLLQIMKDLRDPDSGCPWDIEQDFASIAAYTVEEAYEVADAIERNDLKELKGELGDLLFQVVFHSQMASEKGEFDFADVVEAICEKLVRRHPHVFDNSKVDSKEALYKEWEQHKKKEREGKGEVASGRLDGVTSALPALRWSEKLQRRAAHHGFDWDDIGPVFGKLDEEIAELKEEVGQQDNQQRISEEMGDILFASVNLAKHLGVNPEQALRDANRKFISRFELVEQLMEADGKRMEECGVDTLIDYWTKAKEHISSANERE